MFVNFVAEHNLPFRVGDHFTKLVKTMFPDSSIAKQFQCSRTKTSVLVRYGNGQYCHDVLLQAMKVLSPTVFFSLMVDESNDRGVEAKDLAILVRFFDLNIMRTVTRFLGLPTANDGSAYAIFQKIDECLSSCGLQYCNLIGFNSNTCNTMKGKRNGVVRHLTDKQPNLVDLGCICHLENLAIKSALRVLPFSVDSFLVDIHTRFYLSVKRKEELKDFCAFVDITYKQILAHVGTRWLSLLRVISRVLQLWPALVSYFNSHPDAEKRGRVHNVCCMLTGVTKLYLLFLNYLLPTMNAFNVAFQATEYTTIHLLQPEMKRLTKRLLRSFVKVDAINVEDITLTNHKAEDNQLGNDDLEVGKAARAFAMTLSEEEGLEPEVQLFYKHVHAFYCALINKIFEKFPFNSSLLSDLKILNPQQRVEFADLPNAAVRLARLLPQLQFSGSSLDLLKAVAIDFQMADQSDLPKTDQVDQFWAAMHTIKRIGSPEPLYVNLLVLARALLSLPVSNADSERTFSMTRKIDTEERSHLKRSTIAALLSMKINIDEDCYQFEASDDLLKINSTAVRKYNTEHGSYKN